jgi:hypothetical protein
LKSVISLIVFATVGIGCFNSLKVSGIVVDKTSKELLDSVAITALDELSIKGYDWVPAYTQANRRFILSFSSTEIKKKSNCRLFFKKRDTVVSRNSFPGRAITTPFIQNNK